MSRVILYYCETELPLNPCVADNTLVSGWRFEHAKHITVHVVQKKHLFKTFYQKI